jgi:hypothetical protein
LDDLGLQQGGGQSLRPPPQPRKERRYCPSGLATHDRRDPNSKAMTSCQSSPTANGPGQEPASVISSPLEARFTKRRDAHHSPGPCAISPAQRTPPDPQRRAGQAIQHLRPLSDRQRRVRVNHQRCLRGDPVLWRPVISLSDTRWGRGRQDAIDSDALVAARRKLGSEPY